MTPRSETGPVSGPTGDGDEGPRLSRGWLAIGLGLVVGGLGMAWWGGGEPEYVDSGTLLPPQRRAAAAAGADGGNSMDRAGAASSSRPRPFARKPEADSLLHAGRVPWMSRIRTNGVLEVERIRSDPAYLRRVMQHDRLRVLLESPARTTPECDRVVAFVEQKGLPLAATVDLYNLLWATRDHQRKWDVASENERAALDVVRDLEMTDFQWRFREDFEVDVGPMLEEFLGLSIRPEIFMGIPDRAFVKGEALLSE